ncbi:helix-turn-helix domain-containing protein [Sunxiuqinia elliptica]|uniref:Helix-turn-helix protein n=1 Tax=Sunxiuqinia elliptica TaxID=655355 RepID=A0A4V3BYM8_9BACT|nr:helix-turn-helix transcriptional regulator [Sunxiuqinia elliptica]TDO03149.1 helix-turn-helix protein [Sunxiuqinia elliptica]TDO59346.1 helix-turn-helix protein [Sunxiuqinia elliptica]
MKNNIREKILNQPSYWIEGINGHLYDAIFNYMERNSLNRTKLAEHLGISKGRVSQILNDGEINFSIEKIIEIALKVDMFPVFEFVSKQKFLQDEQKIADNLIALNFNANIFSNIVETNRGKKAKVIKLKSYNENNYQIAFN